MFTKFQNMINWRYSDCISIHQVNQKPLQSDQQWVFIELKRKSNKKQMLCFLFKFELNLFDKRNSITTVNFPIFLVWCKWKVPNKLISAGVERTCETLIKGWMDEECQWKFLSSLWNTWSLKKKINHTFWTGILKRRKNSRIGNSHHLGTEWSQSSD